MWLLRRAWGFKSTCQNGQVALVANMFFISFIFGWAFSNHWNKRISWNPARLSIRHARQPQPRDPEREPQVLECFVSDSISSTCSSFTVRKNFNSFRRILDSRYWTFYKTLGDGPRGQGVDSPNFISIFQRLQRKLQSKKLSGRP